jgi:hypothetical protein
VIRRMDSEGFALSRVHVARRRCTTESELAHTALHGRTLNLDDGYTITGNGCVGADAL